MQINILAGDLKRNKRGEEMRRGDRKLYNEMKLKAVSMQLKLRDFQSSYKHIFSRNEGEAIAVA